MSRSRISVAGTALASRTWAEAIAGADHAVLYDNSTRAEVGPRVFAEVEEGVFVALEADLPPWFPIALGRTEIGTSLRV